MTRCHTLCLCLWLHLRWIFAEAGSSRYFLYTWNTFTKQKSYIPHTHRPQLIISQFLSPLLSSPIYETSKQVREAFHFSNNFRSIKGWRLFQSISYIFYSCKIIIIDVHNGSLHNCKFYIVKDYIIFIVDVLPFILLHSNLWQSMCNIFGSSDNRVENPILQGSFLNQLLKKRENNNGLEFLWEGYFTHRMNTEQLFWTSLCRRAEEQGQNSPALLESLILEEN